MYLESFELKQCVGAHRTSRDEDYERAIAAATQRIDRWTGRRFLRDETSTSRLFRAEFPGRVLVGDFTDPEGVVVETDDLGDGSWTTWEPEQWQAEADDRGNGRFVRLDGEPWRWVGVTDPALRAFPVCDRRPRVRVTAVWGWEAVPAAVSQACMELSILFFQPGSRSPELVGAASLDVARSLLMDYAVEGGTLCMDPYAP